MRMDVEVDGGDDGGRNLEMRTLDRDVGAWTRWAVIATLFVAAGAASVPAMTAPLRAEEPADEKQAERPTVDASDVYLGNAATFRKPAEVDSDAVYRAIPEYQKIVAEDVEPGSATYELLMDKASKRFKAALRKVARAGGYDLVARSASIQNATDVPDITQDVIDRL